MPASAFRRWLRRQPHPTRLRVDGRELAVATGANMWRETEDSVMTLSPSKVEALDANGVLLRATRLDHDDDDDAKGQQEEKPKTEIEALARIILQAHDAGAQRHAEAYALAFNKMVELVGILAARLGGLEAAWQKAMKQTAEAHASALYAQQIAEGAGGDDPAGQAIAAMIMAGAAANGGPAGAVAAAATKANANGKANGAKKGD